MCHVYYPVASVLIHACLFLVQSDCKDQSSTRGRQDSGLAWQVGLLKNFTKAWNCSKYQSSQSDYIQAIGLIGCYSYVPR